MMLNSQVFLPDTKSAVTNERRRSSLSRKGGLKPLESLKKPKVVDANRPFTSLNTTDSGIKGNRFKEIYQSKKRLLQGKEQSDSRYSGVQTPSTDEKHRDLLSMVLSPRSRCYSSQASPPRPSRKRVPATKHPLQKHLLNRTANSDKTEIIEEDPTTKVRWKWTERIRWRRRVQLKMAPLIILNFEGVLGDYFNENFWDGRVASLYLRPGWLRGLRILSKSMQLVLVASCSESKLFKLIALLDDRKVKFDAVYRRHNYLDDRHVINYSQVLSEFNYKESAADRVLVISSLSLENSEIEQREGHALVYERSASLGKRWASLSIPTTSNDSSLPSVLLVPNPRIQQNFNSITFDSISQAVDELFQITSTRSIFSFQVTINSIDPSIFYSVKKLALPRLKAAKADDTPHYETEMSDPVESETATKNCLVLPASSCQCKPYVKIDQDLLEDVQGKKWLPN